MGGALPAATAGDEVTRAPQPTEPQALYVKLGPSRATILYVTAPEGEFELHEVVGNVSEHHFLRSAGSTGQAADLRGSLTHFTMPPGPHTNVCMAGARAYKS
jgi:hypothetical protein